MIKIRFLIVICSIVPYVILRHLWGYSHKLPDNVCKRTGCCYGDDPFLRQAIMYIRKKERKEACVRIFNETSHGMNVAS